MSGFNGIVTRMLDTDGVLQYYVGIVAAPGLPMVDEDASVVLVLQLEDVSFVDFRESLLEKSAQLGIREQVLRAMDTAARER